MTKAIRIALAAIVGSLPLMLPQQALAQASTEIERIELEQGAYIFFPEQLRRDRSIDFRDLEFLNSAPVIQSDIPVRQENEVICDSEGHPLNATGWADNGDGTFRMVAELAPGAVCWQQ